MYSPVIDGSLIPDYTYRVIAEKRFLKVPLMVGDTEDEGSMFVPRTTATEKDMREYLQANFPDFTDKMGDKMVQLYPKQREFPGAGKYWWTASQAYGETRYNCAALFTAQEWDAKNKKDDHTWLYRYVAHRWNSLILLL